MQELMRGVFINLLRFLNFLLDILENLFEILEEVLSDFFSIECLLNFFQYLRPIGFILEF